MATGGRTGAGRRSARRAYWQRQVDAHRRSGLSQVAFCAERGLRTGTLSFWKWKLARDARSIAPRDSTSSAASSSASRFLPVQLAAVDMAAEATLPATPGHVDIELTLGAGRGLRVRGHVEAVWLVQVLRGLEDATC